MLNVIAMSDVMLSVIVMSVIMLSVVAPCFTAESVVCVKGSLVASLTSIRQAL
jgi:hypothetical protein